MVVGRCAAALLLLVLAGCSRGQAAAPQDVHVAAGSENVAIHPTQYCLDGKGQRYATTPPIIEVSPDSAITLSVPPSVPPARRKPTGHAPENAPQSPPFFSTTTR